MMNILKKFWKEKILPFLKDPLFFNRWVMPYREEEDEGRISVRLGNGGYRWPGHDYTGDVFMFVEDMNIGIMPFSLARQERSQFSVAITPINPQIESVLAAALDDHGYRHRLADAICDFVRSTTQSLFTYGKVFYEIVYKRDQSGNLTHLEFVYIHPLSMKKIFRSYYQMIPWWVARHSRVKVGVRRIPQEKIMCIGFPQELGGPRKLKHILTRLSSLGKVIVPAFQMEAMKTYDNIGFDFNEFVHGKYLEKAQLTRTVGWHQRKLPDNEILEYYSMYRHLMFALSQAIIREHVLRKLNDTLNGPLLNLQTQITISGVPKSDEIRREFGHLSEGNISFSDLHKRTRIV